MLTLQLSLSKNVNDCRLNGKSIIYKNSTTQLEKTKTLNSNHLSSYEE